MGITVALNWWSTISIIIQTPLRTLLQRGALDAADSAGALSEVAGWMRIIRPLSDWIPSHSLLLLRDDHGTLPWVTQHPWDWLPPLIQGWWASQPISSGKMPPGSPDNVSWCLKYISEHWQMSELNWRRPEPQSEAGMLRLLRRNSGVFGLADPEPAFSHTEEYQDGVHPHYQLLFVCTCLYTEFDNEAATYILLWGTCSAWVPKGWWLERNSVVHRAKRGRKMRS